MPDKAPSHEIHTIAAAVRDACIAAALEAYEQAGMSGLCAEGRWENAVGAMQTLDLKLLLTTPLSPRATALRSPLSERGGG